MRRPYTRSDVLRIIDKCQTYKQFVDEFGSVYNAARRLGMQYIIDKLPKQRRRVTPDEVQNAIHNCVSRSQVRNQFPRVYNYLRSNKLLSDLPFEDNRGGWGKTNWTNLSEFSTFYVLNCWDSEESFFKFGITRQSIQERFSSQKHLPYEFEVLKDIEAPSNFIWDLERWFSNRVKDLRYSPRLSFGGSSRECFQASKTRLNRLLRSISNVD